jgi:myosin heavy subunit
MFGFESFENNRFEQLCINYANERLQQHFNAHNFEREREEYLNEGIPLDATEFSGTGGLLAILDGKQGFWSVLEEEGMLPNGSDENFHSRLEKLDKGRGGGFSTKGKRMTMTLQHYAGSVTYSLDGVLLANRLQGPSLSTALLSSSSFPFVSQLFAADSLPEGGSAAPRRRSSVGGGGSLLGDTVSERFRGQLRDLMDTLERAQPVFVR